MHCKATCTTLSTHCLQLSESGLWIDSAFETGTGAMHARVSVSLKLALLMEATLELQLTHSKL